MSQKKVDKGKLFHKLHQLQKLVTRFLKNGEKNSVKEAEMKERHLLEKIKGRHGKPKNENQDENE